MIPGVQSFDPYGEHSEYHGFGRNYGDPRLNLIGSVLFGHGYMPKPESGQSAYDAFLQKERSAHFMNLQRSSFGNNPVLSQFGMSGGLMQQLGTMASPDSSISRLLSPVMGGNPMAASMQLYAGMAGANVMGNFGRTSSITEEETTSTMKEMMKGFYKTQQYEGSGGYRQELVANTRKFLKDRANEGKAGQKYLKDLGIDPDKIDTYDPTPAATSGIRSDLTKSLAENDEKIKKSLQDRVKKQIEEQGIASSSEIEKAMQDTSGNEAVSLLNKYEDKQKKVTRQLKDSIEAKMAKANEMDNQLTDIENEPDKNVRRVRQDKLQEEIKSHFDLKDEKQKAQYEYLLKEKSGIIDSVFGSDELDPVKTREYIANSRELDIRQKTMLEAEGRPTKIKGIDFENTRGYKIEDYTSAFVKASELRALGDRKGSTIQEAGRDFQKNAGQWMDAAKSVFGDKSGSELVESTSRLVGKDKLDLSSAKGVGEASDLLRKVKATARVAGVSLNTMLSIIDSANDLVRNNPQLQFASQTAVTNLSMKAVQTAASLGTALKAEDYRQMGGAQGIAGAEVKEGLEYAQSSKGAAVAAWLQAAKDNGKLDEAIEAFQKGEFSAESLATGQGLDKLASLTGRSTAEVVAMGHSSNAVMQQRALKDQKIFEAVSQQGKEDRARDFYSSHMLTGELGANGVNTNSEEEVNRRFAESQARGESLDAFFNKEFISKNVGNPEAQGAAVKYEQTLKERLINSQRSKEEDVIAARVKAAADTQEETSKKFAAIQAPVVTQAISALMEGKTGKNLTEALTGIFAVKGEDDPRRQGFEGANKAVQEAAEIMRKNVGGDKELYKPGTKGGISEKLNDLVRGRIKAAKAIEDTRSTKGMEANLTPEGLQRLVESGGQLRSDPNLDTAAKRKQRLQELEEEAAGGFKGSSKEQRDIKERTLDALRKHKSLGTLEDDAAFKAATGGTVAGVLGGATLAQVAAEKKRLLQESKNEDVQTMDVYLSEASQKTNKEGTITSDAQEVQQARAYYVEKYGEKDASAKMLEEYEKRGISDEDNKDNYFRQNKISEKGRLAGILVSTSEKIASDKQKVEGMGKSPTEATQDLNATMQNIAKLFNEDSGLGKVLTKLVDAIGGLK